MAIKLDPAAAPFSPSTAEPRPSLDLVTPHLDDDDKPPASFTRLPVELKEQIVAEVIETDRKHDPRAALVASVTVGFFAKRRVTQREDLSAHQRKREALSRMQAVDRELRAICAPQLWKAIIARNVQSQAFARLLEILPEHAARVRRLDAVGSTLARRASPERRALYLSRNQCIGRAMRSCTNLEELYLCHPQLNPLLPFPFPHLRTLRILSPDSERRRKSYLLDHEIFLAASPFPDLTSLELYVDGADTSGDEFLDVVKVLRGVPSLKNLKLRGDAVVRDEALGAYDDVAISGMPALESLEVKYDGETVLDLGVMHAFISVFATSLAALNLELSYCDEDDPPSAFECPLPHLAALALGGDCPTASFHALSSPSTPITFCHLDTLGRDVDPEIVYSFLRAHASTLRTVHLGEWADEANPDVSAEFMATCESLNILVVREGEEEKLVGNGAQGERAAGGEGA
ncbi:hypothetical protein JCM8208_000115 [Rhodotorula glutinis]